MVCSGEQCWGPGVSMVTLPMPCVGVSLLAGCQWALLELQVKEQSLSGHTCWGGLLWVEGDLAPVSWE